MNRGIFRLAMLFITGRSGAWHQYLVGALLVALFLLSILVGRKSGDFSMAMAMAALFNGVIWLSGTVGMLATVRELRGLRAPHVYRKAGKVLGLVALLTLIVPATLLLLSQDAASGPGVMHRSFMVPILGATIGMLVAVLPLLMVSAVLLLGPLVFVFSHGVGTQLTHTAPWQSAWLLEAITLPGLCIVVWRGRALIRAETLAGLTSWSLVQMRMIASNLFAVAAQDPDAAFRMFPAWMIPSWRTRAGASLWTRISTLLGSPFAPGNLRQVLPVLGVVGGIGGVAVWFFVQWVVAQQMQVRVQRMFLDVMTSQFPLVFVIMLFSISRSFASRLRMIHRPQSADLAELALLPGLGVGRTPLANYCLVLFGRPLRMIAVVTAVLGGGMAVVVHFTPWSPLLLVLIVTGLTVMEIARYLAVGRPIFQSIIVEALAFVPAMMAMAALAVFGSHSPFVSVGTSNTISHAVMPALVVTVWLMTFHVVRWAYATAERLPHPFLDAQERRVLR